MKRTTISIPDKLFGKIKYKVEEEGYLTMTDYIVSLVREDTKHLNIPEQRETPILPPATPTPFFPQPFSTNPDTFPKPIIQQPPQPVRIPQTPPPPPLHPKTPQRDPNAPDPYLVYGGKCQFRNVSADNIMCLQTASKKISVAQNKTGDKPNEEEFTETYLCPDHIGHVSHSSGFFIK